MDYLQVCEERRDMKVRVINLEKQVEQLQQLVELLGDEVGYLRNRLDDFVEVIGDFESAEINNDEYEVVWFVRSDSEYGPVGP